MQTWLTHSKLAFLSVIFLLFFAYTNVFSSQSVAEVKTPAQFFVTANETDVSAQAFAVFDAQSGEVLLAENTDSILPIASVTKLITAAALVKNTDLTQTGTVTITDVLTLGEAGQLTAGDVYSYRELLFPLLLESSNDAAAFFERETKGGVVKEMNQLALNLGMKETSFTDASGLNDSNVSTVDNLVTFLTYLVEEEPYILDITTLKQYVGPYSGHLNNNPVIGSDYQGGKHGYTVAADRTLVALFEEDFGSEKRTLGYVLLGSEDLAEDTTKLRNFVAKEVTFK
jgi:serine-type D-Ala-D-Ala endopeptidase (penicillin-binding protein 7)